MKDSKSIKFSSKANTLDFFQDKITKSRIEELYFFTVKEWKENKKEIREDIKKKFSSLIVVRSSAEGEDSISNSQAGKFKTVLNVNPKKKNSIDNAITEVIRSYKTKVKYDSVNQILIQTQTLDSQTSGVIFTKTLENGSPYYVINFEDGISTDSVTKGLQDNIIKIHNNTKNNNIPQKWRKLIIAVKEIEKISKNQRLDIEFAITENDVVIFQVRPLTAINKISTNKIFQYVKQEINKNKKKFEKILNQNSKTKNIIFSNMTDWNPAEIIGENPKNLDYSLYNFLIMKNSWSRGRVVLGYNDVQEPLMVNFSGRPYVNVQASFESLIPKIIFPKYKRKILEYYFDKLQNNPYLHDKVEFEILFTCYDFSINNRLKELVNYGLTKKDIKIIQEQLLDFTNNLIRKTPLILKEAEKSLEKLELKRKENNILNMNYSGKLKNVQELLVSCRDLGATHFSSIARLAFIATILLKTISNVSTITKDETNQIMNSIETPVSKFQKDLIKLNKKKISRKEFLTKYGHLRPGTYDITIQRYDNMPKIIESFQSLSFKKSSTNLIDKISKDIEKELIKHGLVFNDINFSNFIINTISLREKVKFEFTKSLSDSIELISSVGNELGFSRDELAFLTIDDILKSKNLKRKDIQKNWKNKINFNKNRFKNNEFVELPSIIFSKNEFNVIPHYIAKPNYITKKKIISKILLIDKLKQISEINSKIILIENADPGYDWIFTKKPNGLITKYGGVASHMAIRCAELNLPAAIGCGEILFNKLKTSTKIDLNCKNEDITILEFKKKDSFLEEKRILRSLGYIK